LRLLPLLLLLLRLLQSESRCTTVTTSDTLILAIF